MIIDQIENWNVYPLGEAWVKAFGFLSKLDVDAEEKEYSIDGDDIFARVMSYDTKWPEADDAVLEAHREYVDIQMALVNSERIAWYPTPELKTKTPYDAERDVEFFQYEKPAAVQVSMFPGTFVCLMPQDGHMPQLVTGEASVKVKKVVVKLRLSLLDLGKVG